MSKFGEGSGAARFSDVQAQRLIKFYEQAEREILDQLNRALLRGNKTEYLAGMRRNIGAILGDLRKGNRTWCEEALPSVYSQGIRSTDIMLGQEGFRVSDVAGFGTLHQQAAQVLAENTYQRLDSVAQLIGRRTESVYRDLALENIRGSVVGYDSWRDVARRYHEQLAEQGVTGFKDAKGRNWNMKSYAEMVARTSTMEAHLQGTANRLVEQGHDLVKVSRHQGACELCVPWEGSILSITGKTDGYPTLEEARGAGLLHPNCFPAGVLVNGPAPLAAFARWYEGEIVIITTASGVELPVTPNHPILTPKGWLAAGLLNKGDDIIRYTGQKGMISDIDPDDQDIPTPIEQVVDSFRESCGVPSRCMPVTPEDFHGDGVGSEVYVVWADSLLMGDSNVSFGEPFSKNMFCFADVRSHFLLTFGTLVQIFIRALTTAQRLIGGTSKSASLFGCHPFHSGSQGFGATISSGNAKISEASLKCSMVNTQAFRNSLLGFASEIPLQNLFVVQGNATINSCFGKATNRDTIFFKNSFNGLLADMEGGRKLMERLAGGIATDEITSIKVNAFSGHVYNLQTKDGWYVANSIITHNCRHSYGLHIDLDKEIEDLEKELKDVEDTLPGYKKAVVPPDKLINYVLNKEHLRGGKDKAIAFERALGYNINNYQELIGNIKENLRAWPAALKGKNQYGMKYEVMMLLSGPNGKTAKVVTAWLVDKTGARLVSAYVKD